MAFCYDYPRPAVATDIVIIAKTNPIFHVLLIERKNEPYKQMWAFPGGFMNIDEPLEQTAHRELVEETGLKNQKLHFFGIYDNPHRDPRGRTIGIVYYAFTSELLNTQSGDDASQAKWFPINNLPSLAFDHQQIWMDIQQKILTQN